jgi:hypothetical protein
LRHPRLDAGGDGRDIVFDSVSLNAGIAVPNYAPPSATVQYMNESH